jgi:hypothetical protein
MGILPQQKGRAGLNEARGLRGAIIKWEFVPPFEYLFEGARNESLQKHLLQISL